mmetsp:Transcript_57943/g.103453  ORF Transcript_57943/g.103453 Transcript_57943/m.103453 type:complete len:89 (-) Transcript_57943:547-813(-)
MAICTNILLAPAIYTFIQSSHGLQDIWGYMAPVVRKFFKRPTTNITCCMLIAPVYTPMAQSKQKTIIVMIFQCVSFSSFGACLIIFHQ